MKHKVVVLTTLVVAAASLQAQDFDALPHAVTLQYRSPEQIAAAVRETAQDKMYTPEETNQMLAKIAPGGVLDVTLYDQSIGSANPKFLTYIVMDSAGEVLSRTQGRNHVPEIKHGWRWEGSSHWFSIAENHRL